MKKFIKEHLAIIITVGICAILVVAFAVAIVNASKEKVIDYYIDGQSIIKYSGDYTDIVIDSEIVTIGNNVFHSKSKIESLSFKNNAKCEYIGNQAFYACSNLTRISLPSSLKEIGNQAFAFCTELTTVEIPEGVTTIGNEAFANCHNLESITLPASLTMLGTNVFEGCKNLKTIMIASSNTSYVFENGALFTSDHRELIKYLSTNEESSYTVPATVKKVASCAFDNCINLKTVKIPSSVEEIGAFVFAECSELQNVTIPFVGKTKEEAVTFKYFFGDVDTKTIKVSKVTILGGHYIMPKAFQNWTSITTITLPATLKVIDINAFAGCSGIAFIEIPESIAYVGANAFDNCRCEIDLYVSEDIVSNWDYYWNPDNCLVTYK